MQFEQVKKFILDKLEQDLPKNLTYHSLGHVKDVYKAAEQLATLEKIDGEDLTLLLTAVLFHDAGFLIQQKEHERIGCELAAQYLPGFGYSEVQIARINGMIMATRIPQTPNNKLEQIICDADLDYLGRDDFFTIGNYLFDELCVYGIISTEHEWNKLQERFLEGHHYFTASAIKLRMGKKQEHIALIKSKIKNSEQ